MEGIRKPAVAGLFYPEDSINLKRMINNFLSNVPPSTLRYFKKNAIDNFFGVISPHAGYIYSGPAAAYAYSLLKQKSYDTIFLIGPSHFANFEGFALPFYESFDMPLGKIDVDQEVQKELVEKSGGFFDFINSAHIREHSLEVQLPFLQVVLDGKFKIVPMLMGEQNYKNVEAGAEILYNFLKHYEKHYLIVISSDLSHYHSGEEAKRMDEELIQIVSKMEAQQLMEEARKGRIEACGAGPISIILKLGNMLNRNHIKPLVYMNSGDTSGDYSQVVGYLSAAIW